MIRTFRDVIGFWKTPDDLAEHMQRLGYDVGIYKARQWKTRDKIPSGYWSGLIEAAAELGKEVTTDMLAAIDAKRSSDDHQGSSAA
ncbi:hypothetical protein [Methyloceanibacter caenitepidi]|uniref:Uncharacterized protein n=1 Tax=Methyloceanibacter caenitepidi TaxID=1384459 RepID=A0A0A8K2G5_9HYPH|nr:hypothetical protein [Methyloceanibacter caenitepidi]BAQ16951.1 hypothetical protein GL4_1495 [Methyloceanibacter caenitepidi]